MFRLHLIAFVAGFLLDLALGDPYFLPHPIRAIGKLITTLEEHMIGPKGKEKERLSPQKKQALGRALVVIVLLVTLGVSAGILIGAYLCNRVVGVVVETVMTYQLLATKCLRVESMKVYDCLESGDLAAARRAVSMIVGRDTGSLDETGVAKAAIETVAENTSDGSIAPLLYLAIGGPLLGFAYKAINTMDSMVGYRNERYLDFGRAAAKLDDVVNFLPARIAAVSMIASCLILGKDFSAKEAWRIFRRDRKAHASPNSAQTESACAGALGIRLAGDAYYFGKLVKKPTIGDDTRPVEARDIIRANRLLYTSACGLALLCALLLLACEV